MMCDHPTISQVHSSRLADDAPDLYQCDHCGETFVTYDAWQRVSDVADGVAATASAMLWDFHARAVERYGQQVADAMKPGHDAPEYEANDGHEHVYDENSRCTLCGVGFFLGG